MGARAAVPAFLAPGMVACKTFFPRMGRGWAWFRDDSSAVHLLCILFLLFFHQLHVRSSGIRSQRSELPGLEHFPWFLQEETGVATDTGLAGESGAEGWPLVVGIGPELVCTGGRWPSLGEPNARGGDGVRAHRQVCLHEAHSLVATWPRSPGTG